MSTANGISIKLLNVVNFGNLGILENWDKGASVWFAMNLGVRRAQVSTAGGISNNFMKFDEFGEFGIWGIWGFLDKGAGVNGERNI